MARAALQSRSFIDDQRGSPAIEFALVMLPLFSLMFVILSVSLALFTRNAMDSAALQASRDIRTGRYQAKNTDIVNLKTSICRLLPRFVNCSNDVRVIVQSSATIKGISTPSCVKKNAQNKDEFITEADAKSASKLGGSSAVVIITICHQWRLGEVLPFVDLDLALMQSHAVFRTEAY